jgi:hypothetical protein
MIIGKCYNLGLFFSFFPLRKLLNICQHHTGLPEPTAFENNHMLLQAAIDARRAVAPAFDVLWMSPG